MLEFNITNDLLVVLKQIYMFFNQIFVIIITYNKNEK